jgi:methylenetetrahydrofolate reductase (NADPH)
MTKPDHETARAAEHPGSAWPERPPAGGVSVSFEFFPPAGPKGAATLEGASARLGALGPSFVSITYGAGGTGRLRTLGAVEDLVRRLDVPITGHLTCVGASAEEIDTLLDRYRTLGVNRVVALRGDPPADSPSVPTAGGYPDAASLVAAIRARGDGADWDISVAGYPEVHPLAASPAADLDNLVRKVEAGADRVLTQLFFDNERFLRFRDDARAAGVEVPIVPGIMPVGDFGRISGFAERCGTVVPEWMAELFSDLDDQVDVHQLVAATLAAEQCRHLHRHGVDQFHFYTMNRAELTEAVCRMLGIVPRQRSQQPSEAAGDVTPAEVVDARM